MKFLNFLKQKKREDFLVLDFGSSSVKGLIFERGKKENLIKRFSLREIERFGVLRAADFQFDILKRATEKVITDLEIRGSITKIPIFCGFSPKILKGRIIEVSFWRENKKEKIDKGEEVKIYSSVLESAQRQLSREFLEKLAIVPQDLKILKKVIIEKRISGYGVPSLRGRIGERLDFKVLLVLALRDNLKIFYQLRDYLASENINLCHEVEGLTSLVSRNRNISGIFLDIGKEFTQIFSIKRGVEWMEEFPVGGALFTQEICQSLGLSEKGGEDLKCRLSRNQLSPQVKERIENLLSGSSRLWLSQLKEKLREKAKAYSPLPSSFYLFGGGSLLPEIEKVFQEENLKDLPLPLTLRVNPLKIESLPLKTKEPIALDVQAIPAILLSFCQYGQKDY